MKIINVKTINRKYKIFIDNQLFNKLYSSEEYKSNSLFFYFKNPNAKLFLITNETIYSIYKDQIKEFLIKNSGSFKIFLLGDGEEEKNLDNVKIIYKEMLNFDMHRNDTIVAFGGGVIGDIAGFAASTYHRGVSFIQIPTTIIAQVDSSIGGKTAVNFQNAKNIIGSFYQPNAIFIDPDLLKTLPEKEIINGLSEIIKYGIVFDSSILKDLYYLGKEINSDILQLISREKFKNIIYKSCKIKAVVVQKDEFDQSYRNFLNFGHTFGHAIEKSLELKGVTHGIAVAIGMLMAIDASIFLGYKLEKFKEYVLNIYKMFKIPQRLEGVDIKPIIDALKFDKKFNSNRTKFILLKKINKPFFAYNISEDVIKNTISQNIG